VHVQDGANHYWINPAAPGPATVLETTDTGDLRHALLLAVSGGKVVRLPPAAPDSRLRSVTQQFDLRGGNSQAAALIVTTEYRGAWAQAVRADLLAQSPAQLQLSQIQSVVQDYPAAIPDGEVELKDLPASQSVQLTARFRLPQPFGEAQARHFDFYAEALAAVVQPRDETTRHLPFAVPWPLKLEQHIEGRLPPQFLVPAGMIVVENPAFRYEREVRFVQGTVQISHSYVTLSDHVEAADYERFLRANAQVYAALGLRVTPVESAGRRVLDWLVQRWPEILGGLVVAAALLTAARRRLHRPH
jgi:hypothetical protein